MACHRVRDSFCCSFVPSFVHSFMTYLVTSFIHSFFRSFIHSFIHGLLSDSYRQLSTHFTKHFRAYPNKKIRTAEMQRSISEPWQFLRTIPVDAGSKVWLCRRSLAEIPASNFDWTRKTLPCQFCMLSVRGFCDEPITRPEGFYRVCVTERHQLK